MEGFKNGNLWASFDCAWWIAGYVTGATTTEKMHSNLFAAIHETESHL
jgi:hypothetical protein